MFNWVKRSIGSKFGEGSSNWPMLSGLFVFEFVIVMLGVLAAQALSERFERQHETRRAEAALERFTEDQQQYRTVGEYYARYGFCIEDMATAMLQAAISESKVSDPDLLTGPPLPDVHVEEWPSEISKEIARLEGPETLDFYRELRLAEDFITRYKLAYYEDWSLNHALKEGGGPYPAALTTRLAEANLRNRTRLRQIRYNMTQYAVQLADKGFGIGADDEKRIAEWAQYVPCPELQPTVAERVAARDAEVN